MSIERVRTHAIWSRLVLFALSSLLFSVFLAVPTRAQQPAQHETTITIRKNMKASAFELIDDKIMLPARINDSVSGLLMLDTGGETILFPDVAHDLHLEVQNNPNPMSIFKVSTLKHLTFGTVEFSNLDTFVGPILPMAHWNEQHQGQKLLGTLGIGVLKEWAIGFDFGSCCSVWWPGGHLSPNDVKALNYIVRNPETGGDPITYLSPGAIRKVGTATLRNGVLEYPEAKSVPIYLVPEYKHYFFHGLLDDVTVEFCLDTGGGDISVTATVGKQLHAVVGFKGRDTDFGGAHRTDRVFTRTLNIAGVVFDFPQVDIEPPAQKFTGGALDVSLVGPQSFEKCRVAIDFPGEMMYLSPYKGYNLSSVHAILRIGVFPQVPLRPGNPMTVIKGSPAELAGMKDGDMLKSVNGIAFEEFDGSDEEYLRKPIVLVVKRKSVKEEIAITVPAIR